MSVGMFACTSAVSSLTPGCSPSASMSLVCSRVQQQLRVGAVQHCFTPCLRRVRHLGVVRAERPGTPDVPPPPPPPPPFATNEEQMRVNPKFQDMSWLEFKERYMRPNYLQLSFVLGALTLGLRVAGANYAFTATPFEYLATAASTGVMCMALAWVLFDFTDSPPPGGNFSSPRK
eukprot:GHRQ01015888.1.p1 GENE.GHRQ01015888.1~~GHRQ01015888.1.p1  ORF type:complete len:175 (+),score=24.38 GHRQ01015888.1:79-603(+)